MKNIILLLLLSMLWVTSFAQESEILDNKSIIEMVSLGLSDDVVISKIQATECDFDTSINALKELKNSGISDTVISVMINASHNAKMSELEEQSKVSGIFYDSPEGMIQILPTSFSGNSVNTLASAFSYGIASSKMKSTMPGSTSKNVVPEQLPKFRFLFRSGEEYGQDLSNWWFTAATSPNQFVLVKLKKKKNSRQLVTGKVNLYSGVTNGISEEDVIGFSIKSIDNSEYIVRPNNLLSPGEYCFFYQGTIPVGGFTNQAVFDFSIPEGAKSPAKYSVGESVYVLQGGKVRKCKIIDIRIGENEKILYLGENTFGKRIEWFEPDCDQDKKNLEDRIEPI